MCFCGCFKAEAAAATPSPIAANKKNQTGKEILSHLGLDKRVQLSVDESRAFLSKPRVRVDVSKAAITNRIFVAALENFNSQATAINIQTYDKLNAYLLSSFTDAELTYLAEASKYKIINKLVAFIASDEYVRIMNEPFKVASDLVKVETKKTLLPSPTPKK